MIGLLLLLGAIVLVLLLIDNRNDWTSEEDYFQSPKEKRQREIDENAPFERTGGRDETLY